MLKISKTRHLEEVVVEVLIDSGREVVGVLEEGAAHHLVRIGIVVEDDVVGGVVVGELVLVAVDEMVLVDERVAVAAGGRGELVLDLGADVAVVAGVLVEVELPGVHGLAADEDGQELVVDDLLVLGDGDAARLLECRLVVPAELLVEDLGPSVVLEHPELVVAVRQEERPLVRR